jgi:ligand-binding sensor domain-containing protein
MSSRHNLAGLMLTLLLSPGSLLALSPSKALSQYTRTVWTQAQGLPQDTIRAITQTQDGYLWLGTNEGLSRFDGYEFVTFTKEDNSLPGNAVTQLVASRAGVLWIGTSGGLTRYFDGQFKTFTPKDGLPAGTVTALIEDHSGVLWIVAGGVLSRYDHGQFTTYPKESLKPLQSAQMVYEDPEQQLWVGGTGGVVRRTGDRFSAVLGAKDLRGNFITSILKDATGLWIGGTKGIILIRSNGKLTRFSTRDGLPNKFVLALREDRAANLWVGTYGGLSRLENDRFVSPPLDNKDDRDWVWSLFEDRDGDLWVGMNSSLNRFRDDRFTTYGRSEGLPSDEPDVVHQDGKGQIWIGYHDSGLVAFSPLKSRTYTTLNGLPSNEIFSIRSDRKDGLLIGTRVGLTRLSGGRFLNYSVLDPSERNVVYDAIEDRRGRLWAATARGIYQFDGTKWRPVIPEDRSHAVTLTEGVDGSVWAGTLNNGLWRVIDGNAPDAKPHLYTKAEGLSSNQIRSLYQDFDGTLWIGTSGGGLAMFRNGVFQSYSARDGLLSDNIAHVEDDGKGSLWLSTTRGICRISKQQLVDFAAGRIKALSPVNFGVQDGLRSAQVAPGSPVGGGGAKTNDGRLWFTTSRGLAVIDPREDALDQVPPTPSVQLLDIIADSQKLDLGRAAKLKPGTGRIQFRYAGIQVSATDRVSYSYKLEGLDPEWIPGGARRAIDYSGLRHGRYRFLVKATAPGRPVSEASFSLEVLPHFYERQFFPWLCLVSCCAVIYGLYQLRLRHIHSRFSLVLEERARIAREIHDTLAQGFVGISRQLDAIAMRMNGSDNIARQYLELAQKMARHSLTEARRSVMDLRASALEDGDLLWALSTAAREWTAPSAVPFIMDFAGTLRKLPEEVEHNLLRIAQEAVTNVLNHADASTIWLRLRMEPDRLFLTIDDNGCGFELSGAFATEGGHFGLLGMRERAERLGGELDLSSELGVGTHVKVSIPLSSEDPHRLTQLQSHRVL